MSLLLVLLLLAPGALRQDPVDPTVHRNPLVALRVDGALPDLDGALDRGAWQDRPYLWPRVELDGPGEAWFDHPAWDVGDPWPSRVLEGFVVVRTPAAVDVAGTLYLPAAGWDGQVALRFEMDADEAIASARDADRAAERHHARLLARGLPGAAWFRHRRDAARAALGNAAGEAAATDPWRASAESELERSFALFSGGRAVSENLQLDRLLPATADDAEATVPVDEIEGVTVHELDWKPLLGERPPELDPLARFVPADQHAVFFPTFGALVDVVDEAERIGAPLLTLLEARSQDAGTRARYERQLCLELDAAARALGPLAIRSVAVTGSDPYLRTGSDVAVLLETASVAPLLAFVRQRQQAAAEGLHPGSVELEAGDVRIYGVQTESRAISSFAAALDGAVVVTNSMTQLARVLASGAGEAPALAALDEYRFFRERYARGDAAESMLVVVPDGAIRRWCGPRWRIAASRRTRAAAVLADLTAEHTDALIAGAAPRDLPADPRFVLGNLALTAEGVQSAIYGRVDFQTPIRELELERVTAEEAELYERWRDGYQANWSRYFDPIAARVSLRPDGVGLDVTVMPLIAGSDYRDFTQVAGDARLSSGSGDPHADALMHLAMAIDPESEPIREMGESLTDLFPGLGADVMGWIGGALGLYLDPSDALHDVLASDDVEQAMREAMDDVNAIPLVLHVEVQSGLRLAAFLTAVRTYAEQSAPGLLRWHELSDGDLRYVGITSDAAMSDAWLYYATSPTALIVSLNEEALQRALRRDAARRAEPDAAADDGSLGRWVGESVAVEIGPEGLRLYELLAGESLQDELRRESWDNLPILNEWHRRYPERDPVAVHAELWGDAPRCPGGGAYVWNEAHRTMESSVFGHPGAPREGVALPAVLADIARLRFGLTFEHDGLRARVELERAE